MAEPKKATTKQSSISSFFSPRSTKNTPVQATDSSHTSPALATPTKAPPPSAASASESPALIPVEALSTPSPAPAKRRRSAPDQRAKEAKHAAVDLTKEASSPSDQQAAQSTSASTKSTQKRPRRTTKPAPATKPAPVKRGVSPHEATGISDDDDDLMDDDTASVPARVVSSAVAVDESDDITMEEVVEEQVTAEPSPESQRSDATKAKRTRKAPAASTPASSKPKKAAKKSTEVAVSPTPSPQKVVPPLDPAVRARIASYQQKVDELNRLCERLAHSAAPDDAVLQEIYGLGLDVDLEKPSESDMAALRDAWGSFVSLLKSATDTTTPELPALLKHYVARTIQGRSDGLPSLVDRLSAVLYGDAADGQQKERSSGIALEMEIKMLAQRTPYGSRPAKANLYEDATAEALWCWEVNNVELHFSDDAQKEIKRLRKQRKRTGGQLKSLCRVLQLLHQTPTIDEVKVANEEAKISKFGSQVESELLKARDREKKEQDKHRKEQEKAQAVEEKKRLEIEKQQAKEEEKKRKEDELEAERIQAEKRRRSLVSYFTPAAAVASTGGAGVTDAVATKEKAASVPSSNATTKKAEVMARMDQAVAFLVRDASVSHVPTPPSQASLLQRTSTLVLGRTGSWSSRQHRDTKLGVMKLLQFHENYRPAYYGTFHKRSSVFRHGRRPFAHYASFDYTVDSEEEWEEEEPGESLSGADSDMDDEDGDDQLDYGDDWLAYEDEVEYVDGEQNRDDEDVVMQGDDEDDGEDATAAAESRKRRRRRVASENKKQKLTKLVPEVTGPFVCCAAPCQDHLVRYRAELLEATPEFESPLMKRARTQKAVAQSPATDTASAPQPSSSQPTVAAAAAPVAAPTTPHKPPVKRKIHAQLDTAATAKTEATKASPVKSSLVGWIKTTPASASPAAEAAPAPATDATNVPVEI